MNSEEKLERGNKASAIINSEMFKETIAKLEAAYIEAWKSAKTVDAREDAHRYVRIMEWLVADLTSVATTGELEAKRVRDLQGDPKRSTITEFINPWRMQNRL